MRLDETFAVFDPFVVADIDQGFCGTVCPDLVDLYGFQFGALSSGPEGIDIHLLVKVNILRKFAHVTLIQLQTLSLQEVPAFKACLHSLVKRTFRIYIAETFFLCFLEALSNKCLFE